jgi:hypothetical protein
VQNFQWGSNATVKNIDFFSACHGAPAPLQERSRTTPVTNEALLTGLQLASLDAPTLSALPAQRWQWATFKTVAVHIDHHVELLQRFHHPEHGYRNCLRLLSQAKRYGPQRVEAACALALELGAGQYRRVRDILTNGRDFIERLVLAPEWVSPEHNNLRGASYFH